MNYKEATSFRDMCEAIDEHRSSIDILHEEIFRVIKAHDEEIKLLKEEIQLLKNKIDA